MPDDHATGVHVLLRYDPVRTDGEYVPEMGDELQGIGGRARADLTLIGVSAQADEEAILGRKCTPTRAQSEEVTPTQSRLHETGQRRSHRLLAIGQAEKRSGVRETDRACVRP